VDTKKKNLFLDPETTGTCQDPDPDAAFNQLVLVPDPILHIYFFMFS
jgi:hypothetical protein